MFVFAKLYAIQCAFVSSNVFLTVAYFTPVVKYFLHKTCLYFLISICPFLCCNAFVTQQNLSRAGVCVRTVCNSKRGRLYCWIILPNANLRISNHIDPSFPTVPVADPGGAIGAIALPLKSTKAIFFSMILHNSENNIRDIRPFRRPLFCHRSVVK